MKSIKLNKNDMDYFIEKTRYLQHQSPHQYEKIRINDNGIILILYNSGSLVYENNTKSKDFLTGIFKNKFDDSYNRKSIKNNSSYSKKQNNEKNNSNKYIQGNPKKRYYKNTNSTTFNNNKDYLHNNDISLSDYEFTIGSDETGKGEWFGPLVVCAVATSKSENIKLREIGVKDSKKLDKKQIRQLYEKIEKMNIKHEVIILRPFSYNKLYDKFKKENKNLNHLLAYLHSKAIKILLDEINSNDILIIIDKFDAKKTKEYLNENSNLIQIENGERFTPVATSSIIAKYHYEKILNELEERYNIKLSKKTKIKNIDKKILDKVAKTHFKNVAKYM